MSTFFLKIALFCMLHCKKVGIQIIKNYGICCFFQCDICTPRFREYHERLQTFILWYIDAASFIGILNFSLKIINFFFEVLKVILQVYFQITFDWELDHLDEQSPKGFS